MQGQRRQAAAHLIMVPSTALAPTALVAITVVQAITSMAVVPTIHTTLAMVAAATIVALLVAAVPAITPLPPTAFPITTAVQDHPAAQVSKEEQTTPSLI